MNTTWQERSEGYFFPHENLPAAVKSKLEMLNLDDAAQISDDGTLIPFEKSVLLSQEDAELLNLPPHNPYQLSIRTEGVVTDKNFRYVVEFLNSDGRTIVNPKINGAILHIGNENIFRLNANQFALVNLVEFGNKNIATEEPLITVKKIQSQSVMAAAKVDDYISTKIIFVPDKLSVDFQEFGDRVKVQPVLLENLGDHLQPIDSASFQKAFGKRRKIPSVYKCADGAQYVFSKILRDGLSQIKKVDTLSRADAARYKLQPKELFTGEAFDFSYSDRVIGVEKISIGLY